MFSYRKNLGMVIGTWLSPPRKAAAFTIALTRWHRVGA